MFQCLVAAILCHIDDRAQRQRIAVIWIQLSGAREICKRLVNSPGVQQGRGPAYKVPRVAVGRGNLIQLRERRRLHDRIVIERPTYGVHRAHVDSLRACPASAEPDCPPVSVRTP